MIKEQITFQITCDCLCGKSESIKGKGSKNLPDGWLKVKNINIKSNKNTELHCYDKHFCCYECMFLWFQGIKK